MGIEDRLILLKEPNSAVAESYRSLRAVLSRSLAEGKRTFTIVSSWGGEGKSMVSANLAVAFSQLLMDVILVDGDLRRPTISRVFECGERNGLLNLLQDGGSVGELILPSGVPRLSILPAGASFENPGDLLGKGDFKRVLAELRGPGDRCVVVDTSPLSACSDALLMAPHTDGAVMVVNPAKWQGEPEAHFAQDLEDHGVAILGAVLNNADAKEQTASYGGDYGYGYAYGYGYRSYGQEAVEGAQSARHKKGSWKDFFRKTRSDS